MVVHILVQGKDVICKQLHQSVVAVYLVHL